ncbi:MAG: folate-binding protein [Propionibacteriaceae bacterium]|nr:folate-binding protein [Propionibacteriaceae bacterium]
MRVPVDTGADAGLAWHYGDPLREQRYLDRDGVVDLGNREVVRIEGGDRAEFLHLLGTQRLDRLTPGVTASTWFLDAQGHITSFLALVAAPDAVWGWTEPGCGAALVDFLNRRRFRMDVRATMCPGLAVVWSARPGEGIVRSGTPNCLGGYELLVPRERVADCLATGSPAGLWAYTARRIAAGVPRLGADTDKRTLPNEVGVPSECVALDKGCYPGQETVAKTNSRGAPPRRLVRLHLDGSTELRVAPGTPVVADGADVGFVGSASYHYHLGPIALALVKRSTGEAVTVAGVPARVESLGPPRPGVRPLPGRIG